MNYCSGLPPSDFCVNRQERLADIAGGKSTNRKRGNEEKKKQLRLTPLEKKIKKEQDGQASRSPSRVTRQVEVSREK